MAVIESLEQEATDLERQAAAIRKLIEAASDLGDERVVALLKSTINGNGDGGAGFDDALEDRPRGRTAIRLIVHEQPGHWTLAGLRAEMKRRGWYSSNKGVAVAVGRLAKKGEARRVGKGEYVFGLSQERAVA